MLIRDFFKTISSAILFCCLVIEVGAQRELLKFGLPLLDTAVTVSATDRINTAGLQFSPTYYKNGIIYTDAKEAHPLDYKEGKVFFSLKYAPLSQDGMPLAAVPFAVDKDKRNHKGPVAFSREEDRMYVSRTQQEDRSAYFEGDGARMHIYEMTRGDTFWVAPKHLSFNDSSSNSFHPTISADGDFLIFSSDRAGGPGGFDLFGVDKIDGKWSEPYSLGPTVNSKANEAFPFLYKDRYLFFSSNRKNGYGSDDFYLSVKSAKGWSEAMNIGPPFNSKASEVGIIMDENGKDGFFSSSREGIDNIYRFQSSVHLFQEELSPKKLDLIAVNEETGMRLSDIRIWMFPMNERGDIQAPELFSASINESANAPGLTLSVNRKSAAALNQPLVITDRNGKATVKLRPSERDRALIAYRKGFAEKELTINYFSVDSTLTLKMKELLCLPLEVKAVGPDNQRMNRFEIYIREIGKGSFQPYALPLNEEICIQHNKEYEIIGYKEGAVPDTFQVDPQNEDVKKVSALFRLLPKGKADETGLSSSNIDQMKEGVVIELKNIYYDFDKSSIRIGAERELVALAQIMDEYPEMEIELAAHTDSRGKPQYNRDLSQRRAESAKEFLMDLGVSSERILAKGYGASKIKNHCVVGVECTEEEHQVNRRTEIKILKAPQRLRVEYS
jgi:outer membrane protein OmpA-like peptidoglycan-associated protein